MEYIVFSVIILIINKCTGGQFSATENSTIFLTLSSSKYEETVYITAVINKPLELHLQNMSTFDGWCYSYYFQYRVKSKTLVINNSIIHVKNVTNIMSTMWTCTVVLKFEKGELLDWKQKSSFNFYLNLHVKGAKSVEVFVNGTALSFGPPDLFVPYDGVTIYFYENGEHIDIICRNLYSTGTVLLEYFDNDESTVSYTARFGIQLHSESNNSYIECTYGTTQPVDKYVYRVIFITKNQLGKTPSDAQLSVNLVKDSGSLSVIVGGSVGAVLVILGVMGAAYWYRTTRNVQHVETPYGDLPNENGCPTPNESSNECQNNYDSCHYSEHLPERGTYYDRPEGVENIDPVDHYYAKIDYSTCKPKGGDAQISKSEVYDEPYV